MLASCGKNAILKSLPFHLLPPRQTDEHLLLSSSTALPTPKCCVSGRNAASSNCARPSAHRQLQLCTCQPSSVYNRSATARSEHCSPSRPWSETQSPALKKLHWLPVRKRITFNIETLVHRVQRQDCPPYLCHLVHFTNADCNRSHLRSAILAGLQPS